MNKFVVLSDIHANLSALEAVIKDFREKYQPQGIILLGDVVNYGMRPNEVIYEIKHLEKEYPIVCNIFGNHEKAILWPDEYLSRFSSSRGREMLKYTLEKLSVESMEYLHTGMEEKGWADINLGGKKILCVHGNLIDPYWGKIDAADAKDESYAFYNYVFSGHTHIPHYYEVFYKANLPEYRNRKKTIFLNPGSVGQPRNQNSEAQYLYVDLMAEVFHHNSVKYNIDKEQSLYTNEIDEFYRDRLSKGI